MDWSQLQTLLSSSLKGEVMARKCNLAEGSTNAEFPKQYCQFCHPVNFFAICGRCLREDSISLLHFAISNNHTDLKVKSGWHFSM